MASISGFKKNSAALTAGEWVSPGEEYADLTIKTRGYSHAYRDKSAARFRRAAAKFGGDLSKVPSEEQTALITELLISELLIDVRGLSDDEGNTIDVEKLKVLLRDPDYGNLLLACQQAAGKVGEVRDADLNIALGN